MVLKPFGLILFKDELDSKLNILWETMVNWCRELHRFFHWAFVTEEEFRESEEETCMNDPGGSGRLTFAEEGRGKPWNDETTFQ